MTPAKRYALGERVIWMHQPHGGYGYIMEVPAIVVGYTAKRVKISALLKSGEQKLVSVDQRNLCNRKGV